MRTSFSLVDVILVLILLNGANATGSASYCRNKNLEEIRSHGVAITEFGAVGDGVTLNTKSFQNAIFYLNSFADKGGAKLFVPTGRWLIGSFDLISHLTLWLDKDAVILASTLCSLSLMETGVFSNTAKVSWFEMVASPRRRRDRVSHYLHSSTESKLVKNVQNELLVVYATQLLEKEHSGCHAFHKDAKVDDFSRMYRLYHKILKGLEPVASMYLHTAYCVNLRLVLIRLCRVCILCNTTRLSSVSVSLYDSF